MPSISTPMNVLAWTILNGPADAFDDAAVTLARLVIQAGEDEHRSPSPPLESPLRSLHLPHAYRESM